MRSTTRVTPPLISLAGPAPESGFPNLTAPGRPCIRPSTTSLWLELPWSRKGMRLTPTFRSAACAPWSQFIHTRAIQRISWRPRSVCTIGFIFPMSKFGDITPPLPSGSGNETASRSQWSRRMKKSWPKEPQTTSASAIICPIRFGADVQQDTAVCLERQFSQFHSQPLCGQERMGLADRSNRIALYPGYLI